MSDSVRASKLPQSFDARDWAKEFTDICKSKGIEIDEEWMVTWFANAIMAGYDHARDGRDKALRELAERWKNDYHIREGNYRVVCADELLALLDSQEKTKQEFCQSCGAGIGKFRRDGEGACPRCVNR